MNERRNSWRVKREKVLSSAVCRVLQTNRLNVNANGAFYPPSC